MSGLVRILRRFIGLPAQPEKVISASSTAPFFPRLSQFAEGDRVLVDRKKLSGPLAPTHRHETSRGFINHNDIIGKTSTRLKVKSNTGHAFEIAYPTLDEFVSLAPRKVTPVYASYASLIVSLLDIHVSPPQANSRTDAVAPTIEILESGTGHGSLTMHLAREIAMANPPAPVLRPPLPSPNPPKLRNQPDPALLAEWAAWRKTRRALLHTVEISPTIQTHAEKLIRSFRQGMYWPHIDFHTMDVGEWISSQFSIRPKEQVQNGFLDHVILDMPGVSHQISKVSPAMKDDALLAIFVPSVTQIGDCVKEIEKHNLPLAMEKVVEVGEGISNGRIWDVKLVRVRNNESVKDKEKEVADDAEEDLDNAAGEEEVALPKRSAEGDSVLVCRPKVGRLTMGGGFVGVWRKTDQATQVPRASKPRKNGLHRNSRASAR